MRVRVQQNAAVLVGRMAMIFSIAPFALIPAQMALRATNADEREKTGGKTTGATCCSAWPLGGAGDLAAGLSARRGVFDPFVWPPARFQQASPALQIGPLPQVPFSPSTLNPTEPCLRRIVIDAGHGGADEGTVGPQGLAEKDIVLDVALRLRALILLRLKTDVLLTRDNDHFVALPERAEIANAGHAELFLSIHANSAPVQSAAGTETWFLNPGGQTDRSESRKVAETIQRSIFALATLSNSTARNRGARGAPFIVLTHAEMPSILAEIGFLTNPADEFNLSLPEYRQRIAEALYAGVREYSLSRDLPQPAPRRLQPATVNAYRTGKRVLSHRRPGHRARR
jgi:N-acetylmuramoyl-L-alanine amidase